MASQPNPRMCDSCLAQKGVNCDPAMNYKNFTSSAAWPYTRINHQDYLRMEAGQISSWAAVPGWQLETCMFDLMHNCFLGTARDFLAGGVRCLLACNAFENLQEVHRDMLQVCSDHGLLDRQNRNEVLEHFAFSCWDGGDSF